MTRFRENQGAQLVSSSQSRGRTRRVGRLTRLAAVALLCGLWAADASATVLKMATLAPDGSSLMVALREGAEEITRRTEGRVRFQFYPGGTMGNEQAVLRRIRIGQLHGGTVTAGSLTAVHPDLQVYNLPVLFRSYEEVDHVRRQVDPVLLRGLEEKGFVGFGIVDGGFAYLLSARPARNVADLRSAKAWIPEGDTIGEAIFAAAGISPIPLPLTDVLTGLQTGVIDTVAASPIGAVALQWFTRVRYVTDTPLLYTYGMTVIQKRVFDRLSPADQSVVREVLERVARSLDARIRADNEAAWQAMLNQGIEVVTPSSEDQKAWFETAATATSRLAAQGAFNRPLHQRVEELLRQYRTTHAAP